MVWFGTGEARLRSLVSKDRLYKPMVKSSGAQRESDGVVVPGGGSQSSAGKDPDFGQASGAGTREGMAGTARPIHPGGIPPVDKVRRLQRKLWAAAKQSEGRRFHALYDRICRDDVLVEAWRRVRANRGAAGVDRLTLAAVEAYGVERMLGELARDLRAGIYRPALVRRVEIPKSDGRRRPLGIPTVRDRVCQQAAEIVLEPIFEADFLSASFGFRPRRSATDALEAIRVAFPRGQQLVLCSSREQAEQAQARASVLLGELGLALHPDKTRVVDLRQGREGFDFLGCHLHARMSGRVWEQKRIVRYYLHRWPSQRSMQRARARVKALTSRSRVGVKLPETIAALNLFLREWGGYFRTGNAAERFVEIDRYVAWRLKRLLIKQRGRNLRSGQATRWTRTWFHDQGLHQLMGTSRYPKAA